MGLKYNVFTGNFDFTGGGASSGVAAPSWKSAASTFGSLPAVGNTTGDVRLVQDVAALYWWDGSAWERVNKHYVELFTLNGTDITNGYVTLSETPGVASETTLMVKDAPNMFYGDDFSVSSNQLTWTGLGLDGILASGDKITVIYNR